jgi:endoglucanase
MHPLKLLLLLVALWPAWAVSVQDPPAAAEIESGPGGPEHRYGLRLARRLDERTLRLSFGSSFVGAVGAQPGTYRLISADDPEFREGLSPEKVEVATGQDAVPPAGWTGKTYARNTVTLHLPKPLRRGAAYAVQALGVNGAAVTGGRAAAWVEDTSDADEAKAAGDDRLGIRALELVAPTVLELTLGDGLDGPRIEEHPEAVTLRSPDDTDVGAGRKAIRVGRRSRGECFLPVGWPWGSFQKHELFVVLDCPLKAGKTYELDLNAVLPLALGRSRATIQIDDRTSVNPCLKVNQIGYLPEAPAKFGYLGAWMGSQGPFDFAPHAASFEVRDASTHRVVLGGKPAPRHKGGDASETPYKLDLSGEHVLELDFSELRTPGRYYVAVPGCGRSFPFQVARDVYVHPFQVVMNGVLHQRCGIELKSPISRHPRPACHRNMTELTDLPRASEQEAFTELPKHVTSGGKKYDLYGGHHDAGDYNPRSHLDVAQMAFLAYELHPSAYRDGQLLVPEGRNGVPDLLDEGRWALDLWVRLQDDDGGVRNGTESNGDPDQITLAEKDRLRDFAFAKDERGSLRFAATAAQASILWNRIGKKEDAAAFLERASKAWAWVERSGLGEKAPDDRALAAVQLYRATGKEAYRQAFEKASVFARMADAELDAYGKYDQREASFYYAFCERPVDEGLKQKILRAYKQRLDFWIRSAESTAYRCFKHPWVPINWGSGAFPNGLLDLMEGHALLKDPAYLKWIVLTCDFSLGCHPMGTVFTTRLGQRSISGPLHMYSRYSPNGPIAGIQCEGPNAETGGKKASGDMGTWIGAMLYPAGPWPALQTYSDVSMLPSMCEGIVLNQIRTAIAYGYLLPQD